MVKRPLNVHSRSRATLSNLFSALTRFAAPQYGGAFFAMGALMILPKRPIFNHFRSLAVVELDFEPGQVGHGAGELNLGEFLRPLGRAPQHGFAALDHQQLFVVSRALMGAIRAAVLEEQPFLRDPAFEDELVRLVMSYLRAVRAA